jgi:hypothetical protein
MKPEPTNEERDVIIPFIVIGLIIWGALLALGAFIFRNQLDYRKPLIILACVGAFVGFWGILLWYNRGRLLRGNRTRSKDED